MYTTRIVIDVIDCLSHKNNAIRDVADKFCELVLEYDRQPTGDLGQLGLQIRKKRFEGYNKAWVTVCAPDALYSSDLPSADSYDDDLVSLGPNGLPGPGVNTALYYASNDGKTVIPKFYDGNEMFS